VARDCGLWAVIGGSFGQPTGELVGLLMEAE
jgi:hypothetical protein